MQVDLARPRDRLVLAEDPQYNHYRAEVVRFLHERHQNPSKTVEEPGRLTGEADEVKARVKVAAKPDPLRLVS
jgi:nitrate/nitrite transport system ATP-binding protein